MAFEIYEVALTTNDAEILGELFMNSPYTLRFGATENLYGFEKINLFRKARPLKGLDRTLQNTKIVRTAFNEARKKAGLEDVRFHDLRHTFVSRLVQSGVPLYDVVHLTGHKSLDMVQRYAHLAPDYQERAIQALNDFGHNLGTDDDYKAA